MFKRKQKPATAADLQKFAELTDAINRITPELGAAVRNLNSLLAAAMDDSLPAVVALFDQLEAVAPEWERIGRTLNLAEVETAPGAVGGMRELIQTYREMHAQFVKDCAWAM